MFKFYLCFTFSEEILTNWPMSGLHFRLSASWLKIRSRGLAVAELLDITFNEKICKKNVT